MAEEVINYSDNNESSWLQNKWKGLTNRYHKYKRFLLWDIHTRLNRITPDYTKIASDSIPVLINNFNRLELLQKQIDWLLSLDDKVSIIIIDNLSTYPPLLEFYKNISHSNVQVVYLNFNSWRKGAEYLGEKKLKDFEKYIITDSDLLPFESTPKNLIGHISMLMDNYPDYNHIGVSLEINDLPDHNPMKEKIVKHESNFWPPKATVRPYTLKHVDWYLNPNHNTSEFQFYLDSCKSFATWAHESKRENKNKGKTSEKPLLDKMKVTKE